MGEREIRVFTVPDCGRCRVVMDHLEAKGFEYTRVYVNDNFSALREMVKKTGSRTVPVTFVDENFVVGMDLDALDGILEGGES